MKERFVRLTISTKKEGVNKPSARRIRQLSVEEAARLYVLGGQVMESSNAGMQVRWAQRVSDGTECVIKTRKKPESFRTATVEREWRATTEFQLNMRATESLCQLFEVIETPEQYLIVMEKVEGADLYEWMSQEDLNHQDSRDIARQILEGVKSLHDEGRIHKDLKIENVMVDLSPKKRSSGSTPMSPQEASPASAKLIDFDTVESWEPTSPKSKDVLGTDGYIAPEAYGGTYSPASDIYSVGVIMYKLLTRKFPSRQDIFDDKPGENWVGSPAMKRIQERLRTERIDFNRPPLDRTPAAADLLQRMLAYEMQDRPTAEEALRHEYFQIPGSQLVNAPRR